MRLLNRWITAVFCLAVPVLASSASADGVPVASVGLSDGTVQSEERGSCPDFLLNADETYENGFAWQYGGVVPPDYGAFAECYTGPLNVCAVVLDLSQVGNQAGQTLDAYVWDDDSGAPGAVACVATDVDPGPVAFWPSLSRHSLDLGIICPVNDDFWVGYWSNWPDQIAAWFVGADTDGFGGCPFTNYAPGIGFPTGWNNVSAAWGPTQAIGIGLESATQSDDIGACCQPNGDCFLRLESECDGDFRGIGTDCDPNPCPQPPTGACCFVADGSCVVTNTFDCDELGGEFLGEDIECEPDNPCPQPAQGACCFPWGECSFGTALECADSGGAYLGDDIECEPDNPCPQPASGACCFSDGTCTFVNAFDCADENGSYLGDDIECEPNPCPQPPDGACCFLDGSCIFVDRFECRDADGEYLGAEIPCDPNPCPPAGSGACCQSDGSCDVLLLEDCFGDWQGEGTRCDPNPCSGGSFGACCFSDGSCLELTVGECEGSGGWYLGDQTVCDPNPCSVPVGACCFEDQSCQSLTEGDCNAAGGVYQGDGTPCDPNPCASVPTIERSWGKIKSAFRR